MSVSPYQTHDTQAHRADAVVVAESSALLAHHHGIEIAGAVALSGGVRRVGHGRDVADVRGHPGGRTRPRGVPDHAHRLTHLSLTRYHLQKQKRIEEKYQIYETYVSKYVWEINYNNKKKLCNPRNTLRSQIMDIWVANDYFYECTPTFDVTTKTDF